MPKGNLIIISSPSGGGKGTIIREVIQSIPDLEYSVSYTTRDRRFGEEDGRDYHFIPKADFENRIAGGEFLEYAVVHGNFYGTSLTRTEGLISSGKDVILEIDVQGALQVMKRLPAAAISVFILPPSFDVLKARLTARSTETPEDLELRLRNSFDEVSEFERFDYLVINDELVSACRTVASIIRAERQRRDRQMDRIKGILDSFERSKVETYGE
ncbi:MAG: guanylate kinase [Blastocatellia bacterium]|nr:guanylate kinase [Blastocatellia bacterium]